MDPREEYLLWLLEVRRGLISAMKWVVRLLVMLTIVMFAAPRYGYFMAIAGAIWFVVFWHFLLRWRR